MCFTFLVFVISRAAEYPITCTPTENGTCRNTRQADSTNNFGTRSEDTENVILMYSRAQEQTAIPLPLCDWCYKRKPMVTNTTTNQVRGFSNRTRLSGY